ncbi:MAG: hypothetical protein IT440_00025 [Phycisphaeraceae bacterium]|nr:hypothetical protein [Phycisphaeraceae bacterium]
MNDTDTSRADRPRPRILLLGDSIRISYQARVAEMMGAAAEVVGPLENSQFSLYTLSALPRWLESLGRPDVVHWNNGLHDTGFNPRRFPPQIPLDMYIANLDFARQLLSASGARIIWAATTPVHLRRPFTAEEWSWRNEDIDRYNLAARELMQRHCIPICDLHAVVRADMDNHLVEDGVHLTDAGIEACATAVAGAIESALNSPA